MDRVEALTAVRPTEQNVKAAIPALTLKFWGVRGSIPVSGEAYAGYGGNTPCIEVHVGERQFIIDAGSGIVPLGKQLRERGVKKVDLLLSHLHHDHVMGLFFFKPLYEKGTEVTIYCGNLDGETAEAALRRLFSPPLFPVTFDDLPATVRFVGFRAGETLDMGDGIKVATHLLQHPSGSTAYRFEAGGRSVAVVTDVEHRGEEPCRNLAAFVHGADTVVYDTMLCATEYPLCRGWGHSTPIEGALLCKKAGAAQMIGFHHHPGYTDVKIQEMQEELANQLPGSIMAREGMVLTFDSQD